VTRSVRSSGLWQVRDHMGCEVVNEPGALVRNAAARRRTLYGRTAVITDPFGAELSVLARPPQT
jgi:hypothetical protein